MEITDVQVKPVTRSRGKLKAFCTITFDDSFVVKDVRLIEGTKGLLVAMPVKKFTFRCYKCGCQNPLSSRFCNDCGRRIRTSKVLKNSQTGKPLLQVDVAHPITPQLRQQIEEKIFSKYNDVLKDMPPDEQSHEDAGDHYMDDYHDDQTPPSDEGSSNQPQENQGDQTEERVQDDPLQKSTGEGTQP